MPLKVVIVSLFSVLIVTGCFKPVDDAREFNGASNEELSDTYSYKSDSPYANLAARCIRAKAAGELCTLEEFPLLGMDVESPTVANIMSRVVVSHDWMGQRFEELLNSYPPEILYLFRAITAVVIDDDIRPAYYTSSTGAIYLDPAYLWLNNSEKITINQKEDFRAGFADPLAFRSFGRYVFGDSNALNYIGLSDPRERELVDIEYLVARLILHELAHANDFFPNDMLDTVDRRYPPSIAADAINGNFISDRLHAQSPLTSPLLYRLAGVMFLGDTPTTQDTNTTAAQMGEAFASEGAADDYAYASQYEDLAMLFEETMMKYFWELDYDIAFLDTPPDDAFCEDLNVAWGQRNRIGDSEVKTRAQFVTNALLPNTDMTLFYQDLAAPQEFATGPSWCLPATLVGQTSNAAALQQKAQPPRQLPEGESLKPYL